MNKLLIGGPVLALVLIAAFAGACRVEEVEPVAAEATPAVDPDVAIAETETAPENVIEPLPPARFYFWDIVPPPPMFQAISADAAVDLKLGTLSDRVLNPDSRQTVSRRYVRCVGRIFEWHLGRCLGEDSHKVTRLVDDACCEATAGPKPTPEGYR
jgi:hypothetical protein